MIRNFIILVLYYARNNHICIAHVSEVEYHVVLQYSLKVLIFYYRGALNAGRSSHKKGICPSFCPSVKRVDCEKNVRKICPHFYAIRKII